MDNENKGDDKKEKTITVTVNGKSVVFHEENATGLQIKEAAIAQGVNIKPDFKLFLISEGKDPEPISDTQKVELKDGEKFRAVSPDDKS
jgi:hypothetical protein